MLLSVRVTSDRIGNQIPYFYAPTFLCSTTAAITAMQTKPHMLAGFFCAVAWMAGEARTYNVQPDGVAAAVPPPPPPGRPPIDRSCWLPWCRRERAAALFFFFFPSCVSICCRLHSCMFDIVSWCFLWSGSPKWSINHYCTRFCFLLFVFREIVE